jgi:hypothetical protein
MPRRSATGQNGEFWWLAGLDQQVRLQLAVDPVNAFVVPRMAFDVAQVQETQAKPPGFAGIGEPSQQNGD